MTASEWIQVASAILGFAAVIYMLGHYAASIKSAIEGLSKNQKEDRQANKEAHAEINAHLKNLNGTVAKDHTRIAILENIEERKVRNG